MISSCVGAVCGLLSCYMTLKGWALMGDAVSHAVMTGVVVAYALGLPFSLGAFVFGVGSVALIGYVKQKSRIKEDTVIGLVFTGFFALGLVLVSKIKSNIDLMHILFGSPLGISDSDVRQTLLICLIVVAVLITFRRDFMLYCFDPTHARSIGININTNPQTVQDVLKNDFRRLRGKKVDDAGKYQTYNDCRYKSDCFETS